MKNQKELRKTKSNKKRLKKHQKNLKKTKEIPQPSRQPLCCFFGAWLKVEAKWRVDPVQSQTFEPKGLQFKTFQTGTPLLKLSFSFMSSARKMIGFC